ncbi:MAG: hypothetical protein QW416_05670 [Candidatus Nitrosocaldaceae archaeon]
MLGIKSKKEKEIERRIRAKKAKTLLENYISNLERLRRRIFLIGKEAKKLDDERLVKRQATKLLALEKRIKETKILLLLMEEAEAQKELISVSSSFMLFSKDIIDSIAEGPNANDVTEMQVKFEKAMEKVESLEEALSIMIDTTNDNILSGKFSEEDISSMMRLLDDTNNIQDDKIEI